MTVTTTAVVATNCVIKLDNASGSPTDISGSSNRVELSLEHGVGEFRPFSTQWKSRVVVGKDVGVTLNVIYSTTADEALDILKDWFFGGDDSARTLTIQVPDGSPGSDQYEGEFVLMSAPIGLDSEADEVVMVSAELRSHGEVTLTPVGT